MPSPTRTQIDGMCDAEILKFIDQFLERSSPAGMKTDLYRYQKVSDRKSECTMTILIELL